MAAAFHQVMKVSMTELATTMRTRFDCGAGGVVEDMYENGFMKSVGCAVYSGGGAGVRVTVPGGVSSGSKMVSMSSMPLMRITSVEPAMPVRNNASRIWTNAEMTVSMTGYCNAGRLR